MGENSWFMQTVQGPTRLADAQLFVPKMPYDWPPTNHIRLISHRLASFSSSILSTACREGFFDHAKHSLKQLVT
jgi:hypothetical protein